MQKSRQNELDNQYSSITIYLTPEKDIQISSWAGINDNPTVTCQDRQSAIKSHIDLFSEAWEKLSKL